MHQCYLHVQKHITKVTRGLCLGRSPLQREQGKAGIHLRLVKENSLALDSLKYC
jgi:hypothetical protein